MEREKEVREAFADLVSSVGTIGTFMLKEMGSVFQAGWSGSYSEFSAVLDRVKRNMIASGKWAAEDIQAASAKILDSYDVVIKLFGQEISHRLGDMKDVTWDTMESAVDKTRDVIRDQWAALGKEHGDVSEIWRTQVDKAGDLFKENWSSLKESVDQTGDKVERAFRAAWEELKKRD